VNRRAEAETLPRIRIEDRSEADVVRSALRRIDRARLEQLAAIYGLGLEQTAEEVLRGALAVLTRGRKGRLERPARKGRGR
jgi:hypothetical protein